jgi:hypothetical protein
VSPRDRVFIWFAAVLFVLLVGTDTVLTLVHWPVIPAWVFNAGLCLAAVLAAAGLHSWTHEKHAKVYEEGVVLGQRLARARRTDDEPTVWPIHAERRRRIC